jgi:hypothetical protein
MSSLQTSFIPPHAPRDIPSFECTQEEDAPTNLNGPFKKAPTPHRNVEPTSSIHISTCSPRHPQLREHTTSRRTNFSEPSGGCLEERAYPDDVRMLDMTSLIQRTPVIFATSTIIGMVQTNRLRMLQTFGSDGAVIPRHPDYEGSPASRAHKT